MAQLNFPPFTDSDPSPVNGEIWTAPNGTQWQYNSNIPAWNALAKPGPGIKYRGGIDLQIQPSSQYIDLASGNLFIVTNGSGATNGAYYPGLGDKSIVEGNEIIFDGSEWQYITVQIPYATTEIAGKVELATDAEAVAGTNPIAVLTAKSGMLQVAQAAVDVTGKTRYATRTEAEASTADDCALTPDSITNILELIKSAQNHGVPTGMVMWHTDKTAPEGWVICDGSRIYEEGITKDLYKHLSRVGGRPWGSGDVIRVPDLRGRFIRGNNAGTNRDPDDTKFGLSQNHAFAEHKHAIVDPGHNHNLNGYKVDDGKDRDDKVIVDDDRETGVKSDNTAVRPNTTGITATEKNGEGETRPKNLNLLPCIKL